MAYRRTYRNPPIVEAVCEFRFVTDPDNWDLTFPGKLHSELQKAYPGKPRSQQIFHTEFQEQPEEGPSVKSRVETRVNFTTKDGQKLVSVGSDVLSVSGLAPYEGWEKFEPRIREAFNVYVGVVKPSAVRRVGVRYINKIGIPRDDRGATLELPEYFRCGPASIGELPPIVRSLFMRIEHAYEDEAKLVLTFGTAKSAEGTQGFLLDLDVVSEPETNLGLESALPWVQKLRDREREAFEALITDETRKLFDAE